MGEIHLQMRMLKLLSIILEEIKAKRVLLDYVSVGLTCLGL